MTSNLSVNISRRRFLTLSGLAWTASLAASHHIFALTNVVSTPGLHIDIPVRLTEVNSAFSIGALTYEGDLPASIFHLQLITKDVADWNAKARVIAVFHTNAGHVTLNDGAYNAERKIATGNPYNELVVDLMRRGVQVELCGATAAVHGWGNADLLRGILVNRNAMARMTQLAQEGFVKISES